MARQEKRPKLDWKSGHDPRSKQYRYSAALPVPVKAIPAAPRTWRHGVILDQGAEGACVGYGWTNELTASPYPYAEPAPGQVNAFARKLYNAARAQDRAMGWRWAEGASVLGGAKATQAAGYIGEFRWAMSMEEVRAAVQIEGPVVIGIPWLEGMYETRPSGLVEVHGRQVGGHCITLIGYHPSMRINGEGWFKRYEVYKWVNSWGTRYGKEGVGYIKAEDLSRLLINVGEACVPMRRKLVGTLA